jgi:hypothetical protein
VTSALAETAIEWLAVAVGALMAAMPINLIGHFALGFSDEQLLDLALRGGFYVGLLWLTAYSIRKLCERMRQVRKAAHLASAAC